MHVLSREAYYVYHFKLVFLFSTANSNITRLFEGESDHLVPSASHFLVESDMFVVAGRMIVHSLLHGGPSLSGLCYCSCPETETVTCEHCPHLGFRETIKLVCFIILFYFSFTQI